ETTYDLNVRVGTGSNQSGMDWMVGNLSTGAYGNNSQGKGFQYKTAKRITLPAVTAYDPNGGTGGNAYDYIGSAPRACTINFNGQKGLRWIASPVSNSGLSLGAHFSIDARM